MTRIPAKTQIEDRMETWTTKRDIPTSVFYNIKRGVFKAARKTGNETTQ